MIDKPHKGRISDWHKVYYQPCTDHIGLGYAIAGRYVDHEYFHGERGRTSYVVRHEGDEVETRNSHYTLIGEEINREL